MKLSFSSIETSWRASSFALNPFVIYYFRRLWCYGNQINDGFHIFFLYSRSHPGQDGGADDDEEMEFLPPLSYKNRDEWNDDEEDEKEGGIDDADQIDGEHDVDMRVGAEGKSASNL